MYNASISRDKNIRNGGDHIIAGDQPLYDRQRFEKALWFKRKLDKHEFRSKFVYRFKDAESGTHTFIILSNKLQETKSVLNEESAKILLEYYENPDKFKTFESYVAFLQYVHVVKENQNMPNLEKMVCSCMSNGLEFSCMHGIGNFYRYLNHVPLSLNLSTCSSLQPSDLC